MVLVAKPAGPTSHDVVDDVRRGLGITRVGHLGTLDPFAAGLLVVVLGRATRLAPFAAGWSKDYEGVIRLGTVTTTDDPTGAVLTTSERWRALDRRGVAAVLEEFRGTYDQRPPAFSAVKVDGERAYRRARRGEAVVLDGRRVEVLALTLTEFAPPDAGFCATVAAGTYVRSLARDVGERLGCGAHLAVLTRTRVGPFGLEDAVAPGEVTPDAVLDPAALVADLPRRDLDAAERGLVEHGRPITTGPAAGDGGRVALFSEGRLLAVAEPVGDALKPRVVLADA